MDYAIEADARDRGLLVNVVDDPAHCDFFASAYVKHGAISIAVNSGGASPGFTGALKDDLEQRYGPEIEDHLAHYLVWRRMVRERVDPFVERERLWRGLRSDGLYDTAADAGAGGGAGHGGGTNRGLGRLPSRRRRQRLDFGLVADHGRHHHGLRGAVDHLVGRRARP